MSAVVYQLPQARAPLLTERFETFEDVAALETPRLIEVLAEHEANIVIINGKIETSDSDLRRSRLKRVRHLLQRNLAWCAREIKRRDKAAKRELAVQRLKAEAEFRRQRKAAHELDLKNQAEARKAKEERIRLANDEHRQQIELFKKVALEVLGQEMYLHLWELVRARSSEIERMKA